MDFGKLFKEYCEKQNPNETISGGCAVFVLGFVDFLKEQAVEHSVQADICPRCDGTGKYQRLGFAETDCALCNGTGKCR